MTDRYNCLWDLHNCLPNTSVIKGNCFHQYPWIPSGPGALQLRHFLIVLPQTPLSNFRNFVLSLAFFSISWCIGFSCHIHLPPLLHPPKLFETLFSHFGNFTIFPLALLFEILATLNLRYWLFVSLYCNLSSSGIISCALALSVELSWLSAASYWPHAITVQPDPSHPVYSSARSKSPSIQFSDVSLLYVSEFPSILSSFQFCS